MKLFERADTTCPFYVSINTHTELEIEMDLIIKGRNAGNIKKTIEIIPEGDQLKIVVHPARLEECP